jgi:hypothetical protein
MLNSNLISKSYQRQVSDASFKVYFEGRGNDYAPITNFCSDLNEIYRESDEW